MVEPGASTAEGDDPVDPAADVASPPASARASRQRLIAVLAVAVIALAGTLAFELMQEEDNRPAGAWTVTPYQGLGAWIDVYDWTDEFTGGDPPVGLDDIDAMAEAGIQTVFVQVAHNRSADDVSEPERLHSIIDKAHDRGMHVVAWYLPTLVDPATDLRRLVAASELDVDGLGVDIESVEIADPAERTRRLVELSHDLRAEIGADKHLSAITLTAVHLEVVNRDYWPGYPWPELADTYDSILPMAYWSLRRDELRSGSKYIGDNIDLIRQLTGDDDVPIHPIGGIADAISVADVEGMLDALTQRDAIGGSLYDWSTAAPELWEALQPLRALRPTD